MPNQRKRRSERKTQPYNFGRLFFPGEPTPTPEEVRLQPLGDHVGNVRRLVKQWKVFPCADSLPRVLKAADIHDMGKPQKFSIQVNTDPKGKFKNYIYSFRGHRFLAETEDAWAQALARGHHDFSVGDITRDTYELRKDPKYKAILNHNPLAYAEELYILEMCDQIEAELACRIVGDEDQAESRTFMDYTISDAGNGTYLLDPWPFQQSQLELTFRYWSKQLTDVEKTELRELCDRNEDNKLGKKLDAIVKTWWHQQTSNPKAYVCQVILKPAHQKPQELPKVDDIYQKLAGFSPNPMQAEVFQAFQDNDFPALLVKGPTGAGKTESVLFPALAQGYRLFLPLPARSLLEDQKARIEKYLLKFSELPENKHREISLVVDTGSQMYRWVYKNGKDITKTLKINLRRHLYKGDVILTTLDKFLYRYFSFGDKQKSFTFPLRINQSKTLICFDEAHSYDDISFTNFQSLVRALYEAGRSLVLMTATMPEELLKRFDYLDQIDYVDEPANAKKLEEYQNIALKRPHLNQRSFEWLDNISRDVEHPESFQDKFTEIIKDTWQQKSDQRILAVVQTVQDAAAIYKKLISQIQHATDSDRVVFLYHGRLADQKRPEVYKQIQDRDEHKQPYILITTSAIEVGCDLNATTLISQICPPENLIQRAGRCNRRGDIPDAKVIVVGNKIPDFANTLNEGGWKKYQETLKALTSFETQKIGDCIKRSQHIDDYRIVEIFSMLHDYVYASDLTCQSAYEKGLVITRSWTPSATLIYDDGQTSDWEKNLSELPKASIPLDRLVQKKDDGVVINQYANVDVYERFYDQEETRWKMVPLRWGSAYNKDIVIRIGATHNGAQSDCLEPYQYDSDIGFVDLPGIFINISSTLEAKLLHKLSEHHQGKSVIIKYIKPLEKQAV
ncbi:type I-D CRISPR-associated helicase Cas3' [Leptothoe spongobia]|uniref:Type I-D CRISPR-associated helicase Cas3 n=1 Tax=Leptothoe spongobia TAU-MAC 1115 TaxID=1967444 RepID=A0A947GHA9_9CYAN|nr:type I-D CRISPR-associated helicase Cas3' [Leptothoe spongobia]MBT9314859.1 type I-D CRISPR-associated helicase Cas3' [Leptothoe spongobia TAU-MAC 1115]